MKTFTRSLFLILIAELAMGGGGRLTAIGPISLRMILFSLAIIVAVIHFFKGRKIPSDYFMLLIMFSLLMAIGLSIGITSGAKKQFWWEDVKPLLYFFILPFFYYAIEDYKTIKTTSDIFKVGAVCQAVIFMVLLSMIHTGALPFLSFYNFIVSREEFFFRGEITFTYKGFLFLSIGVLFLHFTAGRYKFLLITLLLIAILFSVTRGFWFALLCTYSVYYFATSKVKSILFAACALFTLFGGQAVISETSKLISNHQHISTPTRERENTTLLGDRSYSDDGRFQQIKEVLNAATLTSALVGHGFGMGTLSRPIHMEISYLEVFHKQGILGLMFWGYLFYLLFKKYKAAPHSGMRDAFFFSALFIFIQSLTNQYVNNPIGLSVVLLSIVCLDRLKDLFPLQLKN